MDPQAALFAAQSSIVDQEESLAWDALDCYAKWRGMGGFEPTMPRNVKGDAFHKAIIFLYETTFNVPYDGERV